MKSNHNFLLGLILVLAGLVTYGQETNLRIKGSLLDESDKSALVGATVVMVNIKDSTRSKFAIADGDGKFVIEGLERAFYKLKVSSIGYVSYSKLLRITLPETDLNTVSIKPDLTVLEQVTVEAEVVAVQQIGDTTQYNAAAFKTNPDASASDLVSKMPGIVVDSDGVTANGESIEQVLLDGKRFFGQDPLLSLNTIPAEVVDKVQVYDEESDQSQFTGFDDGNTTKTMNVVTKEDKRNGQFGKVYSGAGEWSSNKNVPGLLKRTDVDVERLASHNFRLIYLRDQCDRDELFLNAEGELYVSARNYFGKLSQKTYKVIFQPNDPYND